MIETIASVDTPGTGAGQDWQPLPPRARAVFIIGMLPLALPPAAGGLIMALARDIPWPWTLVPCIAGLLLGAAVCWWLGVKYHRHTWWRLDEDGLAIRRGRMWQRETRVPATRVQHLDIKRGPLQRRRDLATLVVHTAGTRHSAVTLPNLDAGDAQRLRDRLGRQLDLDDDA